MKNTKWEMSKIVAKRLGIKQLLAKKVLCALIDEIVNQIVISPSVEIRGFAVFRKVKRRARIGRKVRTGELVNVPAKTSMRVKVSPLLIKRLNLVPPSPTEEVGSGGGGGLV